MSKEKYSGAHTAVNSRVERRKRQAAGKHTVYNAPAFKPPERKKHLGLSKKYILIICSALAAVLVILCSVFLIHSNKKDYDVYITKASEYFGEGEYENALTALRKALDSASGDKKDQCFFYMADCYEALGNPEKAIEALSKTGDREMSVNKRIARLQKEIIDIKEADKHKIAGKVFGEKERVIKLDGKGLSEEDLVTLGKFSCLERLSLENNKIQKLNVFSDLKTLVSLNLSDNNISDIEPLKEIKGLRVLNLDNNPIKSLKPLLELENLGLLSIRGVNIQPQQLEKLSLNLPQCYIYSDSGENEEGFTISIGGKSFSSTVEELDLSGMGLTNIKAVAQCKNLKRLNLSNNKISDLYSVMNLPQLQELNVSNNVIGDMRPLMGLNNLSIVLASGNRVGATAAFGAMKNVKVLDLSNNPIGDFSGLEKMDNIQRLNIANTGLDDKGLESLSELYTLQKLDIQDNPKLSGEAVDALKVKIGTCTVLHSELYYLASFDEIKIKSDVSTLDLSTRGISDISSITKMPNLQSVNLSANNIENIYMMQFCPSKLNIKKLDLSGNKIIDISPLGALSNLEELNLARNNISNPAKLINLKNLKTLDLSGNPIDESAMEIIKKELSGCKIIFE